MLTRQKVLLLLLERSNGQASRLEFVKKAFLLRMETLSQGGSAFYDFVPYQFGPYSFVLAQEIHTLNQYGYISEPDEKHWQLTNLGIETAKAVSGKLRDEVDALISRFQGISTDKLIDFVYEKYPWFTQNAKKTERRLHTRTVSQPRIYTMGYEGLSVDEFLSRLVKIGIQRILDVRNNPVSMRYGFHKGTLNRLAGHLDIEYRHIPELGIPSALRKNLETTEQYDALFCHYRNSILPENLSHVKESVGYLSQKPSVLICSESNPICCHRSHLAQAISRECDLEICHLEWPR